jgi:hypothetical protein
LSAAAAARPQAHPVDAPGLDADGEMANGGMANGHERASVCAPHSAPATMGQQGGAAASWAASRGGGGERDRTGSGDAEEGSEHLSRLWVGHLHASVSEAVLHGAFSQYGTVTKIFTLDSKNQYVARLDLTWRDLSFGVTGLDWTGLGLTWLG